MSKAKPKPNAKPINAPRYSGMESPLPVQLVPNAGTLVAGHVDPAINQVKPITPKKPGKKPAKR